MLIRTLLPLLLACLTCAPVLAADSEAAASVVTISRGPASAPAPAADASLKLLNRTIVTFKGSLHGVSAADRARRAQVRLEEQLALPGPHRVTQVAQAQGIMLQINGGTTFWVTPDDTDKAAEQTLESLAGSTALALERAIRETRESRDLESIAIALGKTAGAAGLFAGLVWLLGRAKRWGEQRLVRLMQGQADRLHVAGVKLLPREHGATIAQKALAASSHVILLIAFFECLGFALTSFPATRVWGELLNGYLIGLALDLGSAILKALPGLFTACVIFYITRGVTRLTDGFFERVRSRATAVTWLDAEVAEPTRRITKSVIWLFALAMSYPYLPGAHTEAFQGLSVLVGLMISLGASNLVGQAASGLVLTYGRVFRKGEYVRIGDHEGTVMELGMFTTRIRTGLGEDITLANANVLNDTTKNYSSNIKGVGFVLDTQVTIGYDTPWRQVHALLELAARRTSGVLSEPAPQVFQTGLSDWYPQYRLVCQATSTDPRSRALILSELHACIQDVFNEYGVQIMSPQYFEDPKSPKVVPPEKWFTAPATRPQPDQPHRANQ